MPRIDTHILETERIRRGLRKADLASRAGIHPNTVTHAFAGKSVSIAVAKRLARALRVSLSKLIVTGVGLNTQDEKRRGEGAEISEPDEVDNDMRDVP